MKIYFVQEEKDIPKGIQQLALGEPVKVVKGLKEKFCRAIEIAFRERGYENYEYKTVPYDKYYRIRVTKFNLKVK